MTQAEFEALQVGDVVERDNHTYVAIDCRDNCAWVTSQTDCASMRLHPRRWDFDRWHVVSRVLSRENVNPVKGGG